jgi:hypothetical protein
MIRAPRGCEPARRFSLAACQTVGPPNRRLKLAGAPAGHGIERLGGSMTKSLTRRLAWCTFAPAA